jgi:phage terminase large subunit-like protein
MLSNTATPKYYGEFRAKVMGGQIPICQTIEMQMHRVDDMIADPEFYYDDKAIDGFIEFCESELTLTDGDDLWLMDSFKLWAEDLLAWFRFEEQEVPVPLPDGRVVYEVKRIKRRAHNEQYLIITRSAAKTLYATCLQAYFLTVDTSTTHQVAVAYTTDQADETLSPLRTAITRSRGPYFKFLTEGNLHNTTGNKMNRPKLYSSKRGIEMTLTNSYIETIPMRTDRIQSIRTKIITIDEWLSTDVRDNILQAARQSCAKIPDYVIVAISSEGTVRNAIGDDIKMDLMKVLRGEIYAPYQSIWYYRLDDISEVGRPEMWMKANPNLGITVTYETYQRDVEMAEKSPSSRNDILAKRFNLPMEGLTYFFTYNETLPHTKQVFWGMPCAMGCDLSQGDDFCAFTFLFPLGRGKFGVKTRNYISQLTFDKLTPAMHAKYISFIDEGSLEVMDGIVLDLMAVYDDLDRFITENSYDVRCVGYDPYNAKTFIDRWESENGPFGIEKVIQGARTESVPLGELKKLAEERLLLFDEELMMFAMGNCITLEDTNGNRKLQKKHADQKIDAVAAMLDAYVAYKLNPDSFE